MFKLELGPAGQFASRGNVCIFPQDPSPLLTSLPPPLSTLHDEICVILVGSPSTDISIEMLRRTPLLVRRSRIVNALLWLVANNPLYADLDVNEVMRNASDYPECDVPIPVQSVLRTASTATEGSSYVAQADNENFAANVGSAAMPSSTIVDSDRIDSTYKMRKLDALQQLKRGYPFIKYPGGSFPLPTRQNPDVFGHLWPTLFPYGVG
ncbi:hypothetical protein EV121DRAFT_218453, partial [Schizophyllum commune]